MSSVDSAYTRTHTHNNHFNANICHWFTFSMLSWFNKYVWLCQLGLTGSYQVLYACYGSACFNLLVISSRMKFSNFAKL